MLGAILLSRDATNRVMEVLDTEDFYEPINGLVFEAARRLFNESRAIESRTTGGVLRCLKTGSSSSNGRSER